MIGDFYRKIGIVGQGFVGTAIKNGLKHKLQIETYDKYCPEKSTCKDLSELTDKVSFVFLCLPTPMKETGECDISIVESVLSEINECGNGNIVIIKSTIPPGTSQKFAEKFDNISIVFNPEFLREKTADEDFKNQNRIILGGHEDVTKEVQEMYSIVFNPNDVKYVHTSYVVAELSKYFINNFLSVEVSIANQFYDICQKLNVSYNEVLECAQLDERIPRSHMNVPGVDGRRGYSGSCVLANRKVVLGDSFALGVSDLYDYCLTKADIQKNLIVKSVNYALRELNEKEVIGASKRMYKGQMVGFWFCCPEIKGKLKFECTIDHLIPVRRKDEIMLLRAGNLVGGDSVFFVRSDDIMCAEIVGIEMFSVNDYVYNLEVESAEKDNNKDDLYWIDGETGLITHNCFPKDINAMIYFCENELNYDANILKASWALNLKVRPERDWEMLVGRAVVKKDKE